MVKLSILRSILGHLHVEVIENMYIIIRTARSMSAALWPFGLYDTPAKVQQLVTRLKAGQCFNLHTHLQLHNGIVMLSPVRLTLLFWWRT
jgi:hypothetical protein